MIRSFLASLLSLLFFVTNAQQAPIAIVSVSGTTRLTSTLDSAALLADTDDIVYLPGGNFVGQNLYNFTKKVTVIGVGHNLDSTAATGRTFINGNISFYIGAQGSVLDGVYVSGNVYFTSNCKIYRTNSEVMLGHTDHAIENVFINQSVARVHLVSGVNQFGFAGGITNTKISNTIIGSVPTSNFTAGHNNSIYENCIFLVDGAYGIEGANLSTFRNCVFPNINGWGSPINPSNSYFYNNVFGATTLPTLSNSGNASGNYLNQSAAATFDSIPSNTYQYTNDYKIKISSPGHNGGTDGKDVGIWGGTSPWVKGNIPPNPHIRTKNVAATTGAGGTLRVQFNVGVQ